MSYPENMPTFRIHAVPGVNTPPAGTIFSRACTVPGSASYVDQFGIIKYAPDHTLRDDYHPITHEYLGYLIEGTRTNLWTYSSQADDASWYKGTGTSLTNVTANAVTAPDGTLSGDLVIPPVGSTNGPICGKISVSVTANTAYTYSIWLKARGSYRARLQLSNTGWTSGLYCEVNLVAGTISGLTAYGTGSSGAISIQAFPGGWYRASITGIIDSSSTQLNAVMYVLNASGTFAYTPDGTSGVDVWGAQLEAGTFASSYIPTTTAANTRNADNWYAYDTNLHGDEATLYVDYDYNDYPKVGSVYPTALCVGSWGNGGRWTVGVGSSTGTFSGGLAYNYVNVLVLNGGTIVPGSRIKTASVFKAGAFKTCTNGGAVSNPAYATLNQPIPATVYIGHIDGSPAINALFGHIRTVAIYPKAMSDLELQSKTAADPAYPIYPTLSLVSGDGVQPSIGTYTRNTTATYIGSDGLIKTAAAGSLRYEYSPTQWDTLAPLNLIKHSQQFDHSDWTKTRSTVSANVAVAPDGSRTADMLVEDSATSINHYVYPGAYVSHVAGATLTYSVYLKAGTRTGCRIIGGESGSDFFGARFNLASGVAGAAWVGGAGSLTSASVQNIGNGWYRCIVTGVVNSTSTSSRPSVYLSNDDGSTIVYSGETGKGFYIWGAQLVPGTLPLAYTKTVDSIIAFRKGLGWLFEEARSNLKTYSGEFSNTSGTGWIHTGLTVTTDGTTAPDGVSLAYKLTNTAGITSVLQGQGVTVAASSTNDYYATWFVKKGNASAVTANTYYSGNAEDNVTFNFDTGSVSGAPYSGEYIFHNYGNGWYRIGYRITRDASGSKTVLIHRLWESTRATGVAGNYSYAWGAQLEAGAFPTSYMPTTTIAFNRSADVWAIPTTAFPFNANEFTVVALSDFISAQPSSWNRLWSVNDGSNNNAVQVVVNTGYNPPRLYANVRNSSSDAADTAGTAGGYVAQSTAQVKSALAVKANDLAFCLNGGSVVTDSSMSMISATQMNVACFGSASTLNGHVVRLDYYASRLTNANLQTLTT